MTVGALSDDYKKKASVGESPALQKKLGAIIDKLNAVIAVVDAL